MNSTSTSMQNLPLGRRVFICCCIWCLGARFQLFESPICILAGPLFRLLSFESPRSLSMAMASPLGQCRNQRGFPLALLIRCAQSTGNPQSAPTFQPRPNLRSHSHRTGYIDAESLMQYTTDHAQRRKAYVARHSCIQCHNHLPSIRNLLHS